MTSPSNPAPRTGSASAVAKTEVSAIDFSCRLPLLVLFISAAKWLVIAWAFELIASLKFHLPSFLADCSWLTYGRVHPAFTNSLVYGFCLQAGLGVCLWILAQTGQVRLANRWLVTVGAIVWNLGVTIGVIGILAGDSTGFEYLEMPGYASILIFIGYLIMGLWAVATFQRRVERTVTVSHWFLFTALFWFPWIYASANLLLVKFPVRGMTQAVIAWWYADNLLVVWLALVGLAALFHFVPRLAGRELHSSYQAFFAYWLLILFAGWGGIPGSAPLPAWIPALSTVGTVLALLAFVAVPMNICHTVGCSLTAARQNPLMSFLLFGVAAFTLTGFARAGCAWLDSTQLLHFTWFTPALRQLNLYGFFAMVMFGAIYHIFPKLLGTELAWPKLARAHLWLSLIGILLIVLPLAVGGVIEVFGLINPNKPFVEVMRSGLFALRVSTLGDLLLLLRQVLFVTNLIGSVVQFYRAHAVATYVELTEDLFKPAGAKS